MRQILLLIALVSAQLLFAADNWSTILQNKNLDAEKKFLKDLSKDSTDFDALVGLIYLSELKKDKLSYNKYITQLVKNNPTEELLFLYEDNDGIPYDFIIKQDVADNIKLKAKINHAEELFTERKFEESEAVLNDLKSDLKWSVIGPYQNISGSGFVTVYPPEEKKDATSFESEYTFQQKWEPIEILPPLGGIDFSDYLPDAYQYSTYYAQTYIDLPEATDVQIGITRNTPIKIWLDNDLIFSNDERVAKNYDFEKVNLNIPAGTHRIMVKSAYLPTDYTSGSLFNMSTFSYNWNMFSSWGLDFGNYSFGGGASFEEYFDFLIRIRDKDGQIIEGMSTAYEGNSTNNNYEVSLTEFEVLEQLEQKIKNAENKWPYYYLLTEMYIKTRNINKGEEQMYELYKDNKDAVYVKYLLSKLYERNSKSQKVYSLFENVNHDETPIFALLAEQFEILDKETNEKEYLRSLERLNQISPSNKLVIESYIEYYRDKGMNDQKKNYLNDLVAKYPSLEETYSKYLEDENYKPTIYKSKTDEEKREEADEALANIKEEFNTSDYYTLINYYKNIEENDSVLYYYDILIEKEPHKSSHLVKKSNFQYGLEDYEDAKKGFEQVVKNYPYDVDAMTYLGDVTFDMKDKQEALKYYQRALEIEALQPNSYDYEDCLTKIRKIEPEEDYTDLLVGKTLQTVLKDKKWKSMYEEEDAFIIYYSEDIILKDYKKIDVLQKVAIKVNTEEGTRQFTELDYYHFGNLTNVKIIKPNGGEVVPDYQGSYIVAKNLTPGDIIVIEGVIKDIGYIRGSVENTIETSLFVSANYATYYEKFNMVYPKDEFFSFTYYNMEGMNKTPIDKVVGNRIVKSWEYSDVPKFVYEDGSLYDSELYAFISVTNVKDWSELSNWYLKTTYKKLNMTYEVKEILDSLDIYDEDPQTQIIEIYNYITEEIDYSNVSFLQSNFVPKSASITCSENIGDCKDVATLMLTMLKELGIESYYSLVRTNNYSMLDLPPGMNFDHVIVAYVIDGEMHYVDLTSDYYPWYALPDMDIEAYTLLIKEGVNEINQLPNDILNDEKNEVTYATKVTFNEGLNSINLVSDATYKGAIGGFFKEVINQTPKEEIKPMMSEYFVSGIIPNLNLSNYEFTHLTDLPEPLKAEYNFVAENYTSIINDLVIFNIPFLRSTYSTSAFQKEDRKYDLYSDFLFETDPLVEIVTIEIPEGYEIPKVPDNIEIDNKHASFSMTFEMKDNNLTVEKRLKYNSRRIPAKDFEDFGQFYNEIIKAENQKLYISTI